MLPLKRRHEIFPLGIAATECRVANAFMHKPHDLLVDTPAKGSLERMLNDIACD